MFAAQEQALRVNAIKCSIDKISDTPLCRLCDEKTKFITNIAKVRSFLNKSHYAKHYKKFGTYVNWLLCKKYHLECSDKCCTHTHTHTRARTHTPKPVQGNDKYKTPWDFNIQTNKVIEHRLPELVCISKRK